MFCFFFFTHPEFARLTSVEPCPSLFEERGEDAARWLARLTSQVGQGVSELKYNKKSFSILIKTGTAFLVTPVFQYRSC